MLTITLRAINKLANKTAFSYIYNRGNFAIHTYSVGIATGNMTVNEYSYCKSLCSQIDIDLDLLVSWELTKLENEEIHHARYTHLASIEALSEAIDIIQNKYSHLRREYMIIV